MLLDSEQWPVQDSVHGRLASAGYRHHLSCCAWLPNGKGKLQKSRPAKPLDSEQWPVQDSVHGRLACVDCRPYPGYSVCLPNRKEKLQGYSAKPLDSERWPAQDSLLYSQSKGWHTYQQGCFEFWHTERDR